MASLYEHAEIVLAWLGADDSLRSDDEHECHLSDSDDECYYPIGISDAFKFFETLSKAAGAEMSRPEWETESIPEFEWIRRCPDLLADEGFAMSGNRLWAAAYMLFELPYWNRAWIFQVVLARELLLCTADFSCDFRHFHIAASMLDHIHKRLASGGVQRPEFIRSTTWANLCQSSQLLGHLGKIMMARSRQRCPGASDFLLSEWGGEFKATDPRDHIYALLGISRLPLIPRYDDQYPARTAYRDYVAAMLEAFYSSTTPAGVAGLTALGFLDVAGIGLLNNEIQLPTWAPNFPEFSQDLYCGRYQARMCYNDDEDIFPGSNSRGPSTSISDHTLHCEGVVVDTVTYLGSRMHFGDHIEPLGAAIDFINHYLARHTHYVSSVHPLHALLHTLGGCAGDAAADGFPFATLLRLNRLLNESYKDEGFFRTGLGSIWLRRTGTFADTRLGRLCVDMLVRYKAWMRDGTAQTPGITVNIFFDVFPQYASIVVDPKKLDDLVREATLRHDWGAVSSLRGRRRLYETARGYVGLTLPRTEPGDVLCLLKGYPSPVLLRPVQDSNHYLFVNPSFVFGLMTHDEVAAAVAGGAVETFHIC